MQVHIYFPDHSCQTWDSEAAILDDDGVGPVGGKRLGESTGLLTLAGLIAPLNDEATHFFSRCTRAALVGRLRELLPPMQA